MSSFNCFPESVQSTLFGSVDYDTYKYGNVFDSIDSVVPITQYALYEMTWSNSAEVKETWFNIGASLIQVSPPILQLLEQFYTFENRGEILGFLELHPETVHLLLDAYSQIKRQFPHSPLYLDVVIDPDWNNGPEILLTIVPTCSPGEAIEKFKRFIDEWWGMQSVRSDGKVGVVLEYR